MADETLTTAPVAIFKKRGAKGKTNMRKRPAATPAGDSDSDYTSSEDEVGQRIKRRKRAAVVGASSRNAVQVSKDLTATTHTADRSVLITDTNDATKQSNWYDEESAEALSSKNLLGSTRSSVKNSTSDGTYKGLANQTSFIQKNPDAPKRTVGPIKAATNIRTITVTDYAPDTCKDYRLTGYCGFGDNCKYLHAREDYKAGWQLDKEWETATKGKKNLGGTLVSSADKSVGKEADEDDDEFAALENIPFKCIICRESYKDPIVTRCGHYFCENCALQRYRKDPTCAACGGSTNGVFNTAKRLKGLLDKKKEREQRRRQAAIENGEKIDEDEDDEDDEDE